MKNLKFVLFTFLCFITLPLLCSCYAFLKADRLVFTGTMAKRPVTMVVDSAYNTNIDIPE